ncbi:MAG: hypothetical protein K1X94_14295 [Sandaracinaceae bacterium]|nr:hypothetical protein [Sandaracinaceae bacterium]
MTERPKIPVVRRRPSGDAAKEGPDPSGTKTIPTPARGLDRAILERYVQAPDRPPERERERGRRAFTPNAIVAPREPTAPRDAMPTPSRPIMRDAPIVAANVRTFGSSRAKGGAGGRADRSKRLPRPIREIKPPTPPKPRPPMEVFPIDELTLKVLRAVVELTARNAALPQAANDPAFVPGAAYRDLKRMLDLAWPDVRDAVQRARPHQVLKVGRFFGRFGPVFVISDYGKAVLESVDAGRGIPEPPREIAADLEAARTARAEWDADHE